MKKKQDGHMMNVTICNICKVLENKMTLGVLRQWDFAKMAINIMKWKNDHYAKMTMNMTKVCQKTNWKPSKQEKRQENKSKEKKEGKEINLPSMTTNLMTMVFSNKKFRGKHILACNNHHDMKATNKPMEK